MNLSINSAIVNSFKLPNSAPLKPAKILPFKGLPEQPNNVIDIDSFSTDPARKATINEIVRAIKSAKKVAILTHAGVDGDAVGSTAAMREIVAKQKNIEKVEAFIVGRMPENFKFLDDTKSFKYITSNTPEEVLNEKFDLVITVDCPKRYMLREAGKILDNANRTIKIDHHPGGDKYAQTDLTDENASAASQVIKDLLKPLDVELTPNIASDLYLALLTDTGGFRFPKDPVKAFKDAMDLSKAGIDVGKIYRNCIDTISKPLLDVYSKTLQRINFSKDGSIAYCIEDNAVRKTYPEELKKDNAGIREKLKEIAGTVLPNIKGVKVGMMLRETGGGTTASIRGNGVTVNDVAEKFGGGGHEYAAGCKINKKPEEALELLLNALQEKLKKTEKS